jgi:hypothetical protein
MVIFRAPRQRKEGGCSGSVGAPNGDSASKSTWGKEATLQSIRVALDRITTQISTVTQGAAQDLLHEIQWQAFQVVVMGTTIFHEPWRFGPGSHANELLYGAKWTILCVVAP